MKTAVMVKTIKGLALALMLLGGLLGVPTGAATFTVTNGSDSGAGSLRQAIADAEASPGDDTAVFATWPLNVSLTAPLIITSNIAIDGTGSGNGIDGSNTTRILQIATGTVSLTPNATKIV